MGNITLVCEHTRELPPPDAEAVLRLARQLSQSTYGGAVSLSLHGRFPPHGIQGDQYFDVFHRTMATLGEIGIAHSPLVYRYEWTEAMGREVFVEIASPDQSANCFKWEVSLRYDAHS